MYAHVCLCVHARMQLNGEHVCAGCVPVPATQAVHEQPPKCCMWECLRATQILHTYGELSDAALLQTYGFIDEQGRQAPSTGKGGAAHQPGKNGAASAGRGGAAETGTSGASASAASTSGERGGGGGASVSGKAQTRGAGEGAQWVNPNNHVLVPFQLVQQCTRSMLSEALEGVQVRWGACAFPEFTAARRGRELICIEKGKIKAREMGGGGRCCNTERQA